MESGPAPLPRRPAGLPSWAEAAENCPSSPGSFRRGRHDDGAFVAATDDGTNYDATTIDRRIRRRIRRP